MPLPGNRVHDLSADDIRALISQAEDLQLDFKREPYTERYNLCIDISAMANSAGGHIVLGVEEADGRAVALKPLPEARARTEADRMRAWCHDWIRPRIPDLEIEPVDVGPGECVVVVRVPQSIVGPHMVTVDHRTQFCRRYQDGNREMTFEEIRATFLSDATLVGIEELRLGMREVLRTLARERAARLPIDPNQLQEPELVRDYAERQLRAWMEREE